jgi:hypothetical protein
MQRRLMNARYTRGFVVEAPASLGSDRTLFRRIALHGIGAACGTAGDRFAHQLLPLERTAMTAESPVRVLATVD